MYHISAISDKNYLVYGLALRDSIEKNTNSNFTIHYLALDEETKLALKNVKNIKTYTIEDIEKEDLFDILKANNPSKPGDLSPFHWALASFFTHYLIEKEGLDHCLYSDTDMCFYDDIKSIFECVKDFDVGLITHKHLPLDYNQSVGYYNVGILYFSNSKQSRKCLEFWRNCVADKNNPYFTKFGTCGDQKYLELFTHIKGGVKIKTIDEDVGHAAPWNFSLSGVKDGMLTWDMGPAFFDCHVTGEHEITQSLVFVHFSHFRPNYQNDTYKIDFEDEWGNILPQEGVQEIYDNYFELCKKTKQKYGIAG